MPTIRQLVLFVFLVTGVDSLLTQRAAFAASPNSETGEADTSDSGRIHEAPQSAAAAADSTAEDDDTNGAVQPAQYPAGTSGMTPSYAVPSAGPATGGVTPLKKPPMLPWKLQFFDNDFSYKNDPDHQYLLGEEFKDIPLDTFQGFDFLPQPTRLSAGGEVRFRQMDESNRLRPGGPARGDYQLWRWRQYVDLSVSDWFRVYAEMIDASMDNNPLPVTGIDVNRWDVQNLFFDVRFAEIDDRPVWFRGGRQELSYGSQRVVSPLDWANTRRNFEGLKFFTKGSDWDFDLWFTRPVNTGTPGDGPIP